MSFYKSPYSSSEEQLKNLFKLNTIIKEALDAKQTRNRASGCRNMALCFKDEQKIRHSYGESVWVGLYKKNSNTIVFETQEFENLNKFAIAHIKYENPNKVQDRVTVNAWKECETEIEPNTWISTYRLPEVVAIIVDA